MVNVKFNAVSKKYDDEHLTFPFLEESAGVDSRSFYDLIHDTNKDAPAISYEPVPRISKRPGDLVLQGSNNSSIVLGTERGNITAMNRAKNPNIVPYLNSLQNEINNLYSLLNSGKLDPQTRKKISNELASLIICN